MKYSVSLFLVLYAAWFGLSGHRETLLLALGAFSCLAVVALARRMRIVDGEGVPLPITPRIFYYLPWLAWQILLANVHVARRILHPRMPIHPTLVRVRAGQRTDLGRTVYANSITLTPGTLSMRLAGDEILVHALTRETREDLLEGSMDRRVTRLERDR